MPKALKKGQGMTRGVSHSLLKDFLGSGCSEFLRSLEPIYNSSTRGRSCIAIYISPHAIKNSLRKRDKSAKELWDSDRCRKIS